MNTMKILAVLFTSFVSIAHAEEVKPNTDKTLKTEKKTLTIESKVTGSQEQPKVLYIMPWSKPLHSLQLKPLIASKSSFKLQTSSRCPTQAWKAKIE